MKRKDVSNTQNVYVVIKVVKSLYLPKITNKKRIVVISWFHQQLQVLMIIFNDAWIVSISKCKSKRQYSLLMNKHNIFIWSENELLQDTNESLEEDQRISHILFIENLNNLHYEIKLLQDEKKKKYSAN